MNRGFTAAERPRAYGLLTMLSGRAGRTAPALKETV